MSIQLIKSILTRILNVAHNFMKKIKYFMNKKEINKIQKDDNNMIEKHILKGTNDVILKNI